MEKIALNLVEIVMAIGLMFATLRYWNNKLRKGYDIGGKNKSYSVFIGFQMLTIIVIMLYGIDPQNSLYLEGLSLFESGAREYWSIIGVQLMGFVLVFILANLIGHILFKVGYLSENGLYKEIKNDNIAASIIVSTIIFSTAILISHFVLKAFLFDWVSRNAALIPLT